MCDPTLSASFDCCDEFVYTWPLAASLKRDSGKFASQSVCQPVYLLVYLCLDLLAAWFTSVNRYKCWGWERFPAPLVSPSPYTRFQMHLLTKWRGHKIQLVCWTHMQNLNSWFKCFVTSWSADSACVCCGLLFINMAIRRVHLYFKFCGRFSHIWSTVAWLHFPLKSTEDKTCNVGKPDRFAVNRRAARHRKNLHMHLYKGIHVWGWSFLSWVASRVARRGACDHHWNPPFSSVSSAWPKWVPADMEERGE